MIFGKGSPIISLEILVGICKEVEYGIVTVGLFFAVRVRGFVAKSQSLF